MTREDSQARATFGRRRIGLSRAQAGMHTGVVVSTQMAPGAEGHTQLVGAPGFLERSTGSQSDALQHLITVGSAQRALVRQLPAW